MEQHPNLTLDQFKKLLKKCSGKTVAIDTETTGVKFWTDHLTTVGIYCPSLDIAGSIDIGYPVEDPNTPEVLAFEKSVREIVNTTLKAGTTVVMHNLKFDMGMLGVDPASNMNGWKIFDTTIMIHLYDSRLKKGLEIAEKTLLGGNSKRDHIEQAPTNIKIRKKVWLWPPHIRQDYCINDCIVTNQLYELLWPLLERLELIDLLYKDMKFLKQIYRTEHRGILLNQEFCGQAQMALQGHAMDLQQRLYDAVGYEFNWRSAKQLSKALYDDIGWPRPKNPFDTTGQSSNYKTKLGYARVAELKKGGDYNSTLTSTFILMEKAKHPLGELVSSLREAAKLAKTISLWLSLVDSESVIHSNFNLTGTRTGRLSSSQPNLANVASDVRGRFTQGTYTGGVGRTNEYNLRHAFVARPGFGILSVDYTQMESRGFAVMSEDEHMLSFVKTGNDIHLMIAHRVWGECGKELDKIHREWSKTISFSLLYGMTSGSLQHKLNMTAAEANKIIDDYWSGFPRIRPYLHEIINTCKEQGFVRYWSGRIWREDVEFYMYKAVNAMIQGGMADLLSIAAMRVQKYLDETGYGFIISYIYDEILMEVKLEHMEEVANEVGKLMLVEDLFGIPFLDAGKVGTSYGDLHDMDKDENGRWILPKEKATT